LELAHRLSDDPFDIAHEQDQVQRIRGRDVELGEVEVEVTSLD
jgi:hypothetical protein